MRLVLVRHGLAVEADLHDGDDASRPLTAEGEKRTSRAARGLGRLGVRPVAILTSPCLRARETARLVARALGVERIEETTALLPGADPAELVGLLGTRRGAHEVELLAIGHAPHLDTFLAAVLAPGAAPFTALRKAGAAALDLEFARSGRPPRLRAARLHWLLPGSALRRL